MTVDDLSTAVAELEAAPNFPAAYVGRVRTAVKRLEPFPPFPMDVPQALALVTQQSRIDVDVPFRSRRRSAKVAKVAVKRITAFYLRYLADQVGDLGQALVHMGTALAVKVEGVEADLVEARASTDAELARLADRVAALEQAQKAAPPRTTAGGGRAKRPPAEEARPPAPSPEP
ncbi:MAG TPA: hypothetical protein VKY26_10500 [Actinomycetota bacterium]|nr:hypothetical protein [Actinomycetota bacterium]